MWPKCLPPSFGSIWHILPYGLGRDVYKEFQDGMQLWPSWISDMGGSRGEGQGVRTPLKNHKNIGSLCNTGLDPLKNHKATKSAFNVGPSSTHQRNANEMAFCWGADDGPFIAVFGSSFPSSTKKKKKPHQIWTPSDIIFWIQACQKGNSLSNSESPCCCITSHQIFI